MTDRDSERAAVVERALSALDLDARCLLVAGQDMWTLPALAEIGLDSLVMSDGPIGVRGVRWSPEDPSIALPSPTALAAGWDPALARRAGQLLAQEARRKGVHVVLGPTLNLHRTPLGGRHFECYSEDPLLAGEIGAAVVTGVQEGGVAATPKHFVANDSETERFSVDVRVSQRALRELYLTPFETVVRKAEPWVLMAAYNGVNGTTMTQHGELQNDILRGEWGFDGAIVSDWLAARDTAGAATGGLDIAMPGPFAVFGQALADAVRAGTVPEDTVAEMARNVLRLAARVGALAGAEPAVAAADLPPVIDGEALAREIAQRSIVLLRNENNVLPLAPVHRIALIGHAADHARVLGGGSAQVFPPHIVSPLDGLRSALGAQTELVYAVGADPRVKIPPAATGFELRVQLLGEDDRVLGDHPLPEAALEWIGDYPDGVTPAELRAIVISGTFTPKTTGVHTLTVSGVGEFRLDVAGQVRFDDTIAAKDDPTAFLNPPEVLVEVKLEAGQRISIELRHAMVSELPLPFAKLGLGHREPDIDPEALIAEAVAAAASADVAIVVVATTAEVESEGFDRTSLALPGRQDELVARVIAANPRTIVVVNTGSPVHMPWASDAAAILLTWFPGQEGGAALADVLLGHAEPGGRLPTTWPVHLDDSPVSNVTPTDGTLVYTEDAHIGYRAWQRLSAEPAYWFGHGLGYTTWEYESAEFTATPEGADLGTLTVRIRNSGERAGRETIQTYLAPNREGSADLREQRLAAFAVVEAGPGQHVSVDLPIPGRAAQIWDEAAQDWVFPANTWQLLTGRSIVDPRIATTIHLGKFVVGGE
ncbi:glycosyl hydrolase [Nocardia sp. SYP-A9097]|uniref:glycoside hydrolase family 3 C-terminal domain-containing protein n=1 Tax=Nocardia sp. SYP-A9097 TaxID=2663237 RepID=UPI00129A94F0|nr:glycoside hydrolase family 3 C-terminal domain-containing protein [Nocardia sp. SYP-A9097]MRH86642.1 glycosyl hydrolase [Nocardia sp. SYP-A9097]